LKSLKTGFTLLELIVVIIIVGILAVIALPVYSKIKESSLDRQAIANLKLIQAAEKARKLIESVYVSASDAAALNSALRLALPTSGTLYWSYKAVVSGATFTAKAQRTTALGGNTSHDMCLDETSNEPTTDGSCTW
jgi:prepilin-type N-terminal cleavage/methylation domain-containing protein